VNIPISLGAIPAADSRCKFEVWAPLANKISVHIVAPAEQVLPLAKRDRGYFRGILEGVEPGSLYFYRIDDEKVRPDPASRFQPQGVHGPSQVMDSQFPWTDQCWSGLPLRYYIIYEVHVGTFTSEGTFDAIVPHLDRLTDLGITALELMPVAQFPGSRNWGYDGTYPFAVQDTYGGADGFKRLVNACHHKGLAVVLDVVYNHLGPEGNYLGDFGPYFTDRYRTAWGRALNFDGPESDEVRRFFIENALYWIREYHIDALRLDALHAIVDQSPYPFVAELAEAVHSEAERLNRRVYLMAESDHNDVRLIRPRELGGYGLDAHWNDDFHHALHTVLTGEQTGYYEDFGSLEGLAKALREGFVYSGQYSHYRQRRHGSAAAGIRPHHFVVFAQNHDQVGNRLAGERLSRLVSFESLKLAAGVTILSPAIPLLFMGEEYGETAPFQYFVNHTDPDLIEAVRRGRAQEFAAFRWMGDPPDPQAEETFQRSKLDFRLCLEGDNKILLEFYRALLKVRARVIRLSNWQSVECYETAKVLLIQVGGAMPEAVMVFHFGQKSALHTLPWPLGRWDKRLDSAEKQWGGPGSRVPAVVSMRGEIALELPPESFALFELQEET
jgi:maltooligosyltrehalose trehalohydrolase